MWKATGVAIAMQQSDIGSIHNALIRKCSGLPTQSSSSNLGVNIGHAHEFRGLCMYSR